MPARAPLGAARPRDPSALAATWAPRGTWSPAEATRASVARRAEAPSRNRAGARRPAEAMSRALALPPAPARAPPPARIPRASTRAPQPALLPDFPCDSSSFSLSSGLCVSLPPRLSPPALTVSLYLFPGSSSSCLCPLASTPFRLSWLPTQRISVCLRLSLGPLCLSLHLLFLLLLFLFPLLVSPRLPCISCPCLGSFSPSPRAPSTDKGAGEASGPRGQGQHEL